MRIVLDTNFAISCIRQKIDLFDFEKEEVRWIIPFNVLDEIKKISSSKEKTVSDRNAASLFLEILDSIEKRNLEFVKLKIENVDDALVDFCNKNPTFILATLDKKLKSKIKNKKLSIKGKKFLKIESKEI
jgi:rRNA-processing protein FCF1